MVEKLQLLTAVISVCVVTIKQSTFSRRDVVAKVTRLLPVAQCVAAFRPAVLKCVCVNCRQCLSHPIRLNTLNTHF